MASAVFGGSDASENTAFTPSALILSTRSEMSLPDSSAWLSKLGITEPTNSSP